MNSSDESADEMPQVYTASCSSVHPYQFEPTARKTTVSDNDDNSLSESESSSESGGENGDSQIVDDVSTWCSCSRCGPMPTRRESKCCLTTNIVDGMVEEAELECITEHEGFLVNCTNRYVLETSYYEYIEDNGPIEDGTLIHETYRYIAYRRFVRWVWHRLGKKNRRILPACVVHAIRNAFPSQEYCGFKYPDSE